jgi:hypothetical protein
MYLENETTVTQSADARYIADLTVKAFSWPSKSKTTRKYEPRICWRAKGSTLRNTHVIKLQKQDKK